MQRIVLLLLSILAPLTFALAAVNAFTIVVSPTGETSLNGQPLSGVLELTTTQETVRVPIYESAGSAISQATITLTLPVTMPIEWQPRLIPSQCPCQTTVERTGARTYRLIATGIVPGSGLTLAADFPLGTFQLSRGQQAALGLERASPWLTAIAIGILVGSIGVLIWLARELAELRKFKLTPLPVSTPPDQTPPAVISTIPSGKMTAATVAAMLLDLAQRGFITIVHTDRIFQLRENKQIDLTGPGFALGSLPGDSIPAKELRKAAAEGLSMAEKYLLSKLFTQGHLAVSDVDLRRRFSRRISSWKIGKVYAEFYKQLSQDGFFIRNPHDAHLKYRGLGIGIFFCGLLGFISSFWLPGNPLYLELTWALVALSGYIITQLVPFLPLLTVQGQAEWARWANFRLYLIDPQPLPAGQAHQFFAYLAYAVAFRELPHWAARFGQQETTLPGWYQAQAKRQPIGQVAADLGGFVDHIAHVLAAIHEHTVR